MKKYHPLGVLPSDGDIEQLVQDFGKGAVMCFLAIMGEVLSKKSNAVREDLLPQWAAAVAWCKGKYMELDTRKDGGENTDDV